MILASVQASELGMTRENGYVWLMYAWYGANWWIRELSSKCTIATRVAMIEGAITIDHFPFVERKDFDKITDLGVVNTIAP